MIVIFVQRRLKLLVRSYEISFSEAKKEKWSGNAKQRNFNEMMMVFLNASPTIIHHLQRYI